MTQFSMGDIAEIGLLKMDFLGLANLTILEKAREIIAESHGVEIDLQNIPMDDARTFNLLSSGETTGVFQLEGAGMRRYIKDLKPTAFSDISAMVALYRPGPMEHIPTFIKAKHGLEPIRYPHPALENILQETYGVIVYQDQVLFIVREFAGYSLGQADIFRKAMGKKIPEVMKKERRRFIEGAKKNGFSTDLATQVFNLIEPFAGYAFNKAHSVSYALIAYQTAYLKANYPAEYMTAFLTIHADQPEKVASAVTECRRLDIKVLPPNINHSQVNFSIEKDGAAPAIRFGLSAIKNVGPGAVEPMVAERDKNGEFRSIEDLCRRCDLRGINRRVIESLIKAGAFDPLGSRAELLSNVNRIIALAQREQRLRESGQSTMFDLWGEKTQVPMPSLDLSTADDVPMRERLAWEKELTGVYLSEHPFSAVAGELSAETTLVGQIDAELNGQMVDIVGMVGSVRLLFTREGKQFASVILEDLSGQVEIMVWPKVYAETGELWQEGDIVEVSGKVRMREERLQLSCEKAQLYRPVEEKAEAGAEVETEAEAGVGEGEIAQPPAEVEPAVEETKTKEIPMENRRLVISLNQTSDAERDKANLYTIIDILRGYPGHDEVKLKVANGNKITHLRLFDIFADYCPELHARLVEVVGDGGLKLEKK
jgi:DNA polymerase-3 subunit alpha